MRINLLILVALYVCLVFPIAAGPGLEDDATDPTGCEPKCRCEVGAPVNIGSGSVSVTISLVELSGTPQPVELTLTYHSVTRLPAGARRPLGTRWTHTFNMSVHQISPQRLLMVTPGGHNWFFDGGPSVWNAIVPASAQDRIEAVDDEYVLTTLEGEHTRFDLATGRWLSTTDRWGNTIQGQYDPSGNLTAVIDALVRLCQIRERLRCESTARLLRA